MGGVKKLTNSDVESDAFNKQTGCHVFIPLTNRADPECYLSNDSQFIDIIAVKL